MNKPTTKQTWAVVRRLIAEIDELMTQEEERKRKEREAKKGKRK